MPQLDSMEDVVRVSLVCRYWREIALSAPRIWTEVHVVLDRMDPVIVGRFCKRSAPLPLSIRCANSGGYKTRVDPAIYLVLADNAPRIREFVVPDVNCHLLDTLQARDVLTRPFPLLEILWVGRTTSLPATFLGDCAPNLTTLCLPASAVPLAGDYPALWSVTTFRVLSGLLIQQVLERVLTLCPNLKSLVHAASFRRPTLVLPRYAVNLDTLCFFDSQVAESFVAPMLELLNHSRIRHITVLDTHTDSIDIVVEPLRAVVHALFDWENNYMELADERGFTRCFHRCDPWGVGPFRHLCTLPTVRWELTSMAIVGAVPRDFPIPAVNGLSSLTIGVTWHEPTPPAFSCTWTCPALSVLRLSSYCYGADLDTFVNPTTLEISSLDVGYFIATRLEVARLDELRLNSVRLIRGGREIADLPFCDHVVQSEGFLGPSSYDEDLPYRLDKPWAHEGWHWRPPPGQEGPVAALTSCTATRA
ncbi:hypothetical protein AURDEDRAFT_184856 [Auricularia subglabra TFB-10046 SS5]|nr:hypothetical protein AURDEDRAFT_184856 [Auricularia subglabra TFB-10046 SS5]